MTNYKDIQEFLDKFKYNDKVLLVGIKEQLELIKDDFLSIIPLIQLRFCDKINSKLNKFSPSVFVRFLQDYRYGFRHDKDALYLSLFSLSIIETVFYRSHRRDLKAIKHFIWDHRTSLQDWHGQLEIAKIALFVYHRPSYTYIISGKTFIEITERIKNNAIVWKEMARRRCQWYELIRTELEENKRMSIAKRSVEGILEMLNTFKDLEHMTPKELDNSGTNVESLNVLTKYYLAF